MTVVAFKNGVMACDSQISGDYIQHSTSKICKGDKMLVGSCGDMIAAWSGMQWLIGELDERPVTSKEDDVLFLIARGKQLFYADYEFREAPIRDRMAAIGSGGTIAMASMISGASAKEAVRLAIRFDPYCGGRVLEYELD